MSVNLAETAEEKGIRYFLISFTDLFGVVRSKLVPASAIAGAEAALSVSATGSPDTVRRQLREMIDRYQPDELMLTGMMFEPGARKRSFEIGAQILSDMKTPAMT